jgi:hypothetical protein
MFWQPISSLFLQYSPQVPTRAVLEYQKQFGCGLKALLELDYEGITNGLGQDSLFLFGIREQVFLSDESFILYFHGVSVSSLKMFDQVDSAEGTVTYVV